MHEVAKGASYLGPIPEGVSVLEAARAVDRRYEMDPSYASGSLTICEVLREIHRASDDPGAVRELSRTAYDCAKRMYHRLVEYAE